MKVVVTGGSGKLGRWVVRELISGAHDAPPHDVTVFDRARGPTAEAVHHLSGDIVDLGHVVGALGGVSDDALAAYDANWTVCEETAAAHGRTADRRDFRVALFMHLADSAARARDDVRFGIDGWARYARDILPFGPVPDDVTDVTEFLIESRRAVIGTPGEAIDAIERAQAGSGGFGVVLLMAHDWADWDAARRSYELFARHVIAHFRGGLDGRRTSYDFAKARLPNLMPAAREGLAAANKGDDR